ncbi:MAG: HDOD domain-containing protein [Planctomycetes bacterium]|nr:HDOD domain-containing protein [Planctomycetota bacterium]MCC7170325.1 HDOD domain-containing protein [Planctomycetota bacterium]
MSETATQSSPANLPEILRTDLESALASGKLEMPVLPDVATQVISASSDENCDIKALTAIVNRDQSMTGHMLHLCNSALYSGKVQIVSLQQALSRLGLKKIREMALIISCQSRVFKVDGLEEVIRALFRHSMGAAVIAQEVARMRRWNVEEAFLCGLLHDVGRPVVLQALVDASKRLKVTVSEEALFAAADEFHCRVGADVVHNWKLPARMSETILFHHDPTSAPSAAQTAMMTRLADDIAHWLVGPRAVDEAAVRDHPMLAKLNIYPEELDDLIANKDKFKLAVEAVA